MKSFPFIVCVLVGVWVGYYVGTNQSIDLPVTKSDPVAPGQVSVKPEMVKHESNQLMEDENKILKQQLAYLREELNVYLQQDDQKLVKLENAKEKFMERSLAKYRGLFDLTPEQAERIAELEWENSQYWKQAKSGKMNMKENPPPDKNAEIRSLLTPEQAEIFDIHLSEQRDHTAELVATVNLGKYPVTLILSDEQKDTLFANLYTYNHPDTRGELSQRWKEDASAEYSRADQMLIWAAEGVLDEEQQAALKQSFRKEE